MRLYQQALHDLEDFKDLSEALEARALVKAFRAQLDFESEIRNEIEELRHVRPIDDRE